MLTFGKPTDLSEILPLVRTRVAAALALSTDYVFPTLDLGDMESQGAPSDVMAVIIPEGGRIEQGEVSGGGNYDLAVDGALQVELWNRLEVDENSKDLAALTHASLGILVQWRNLLKRDTGLQLYAPVPEGGGAQSILREPMRVLSFNFRPRLAKAGWTKLVSRWELKYIQDQS